MNPDPDATDPDERGYALQLRIERETEVSSAAEHLHFDAIEPQLEDILGLVLCLSLLWYCGARNFRYLEITSPFVVIVVPLMTEGSNALPVKVLIEQERKTLNKSQSKRRPIRVSVTLECFSSGLE